MKKHFLSYLATKNKPSKKQQYQSDINEGFLDAVSILIVQLENDVPSYQLFQKANEVDIRLRKLESWIVGENSRSTLEGKRHKYCRLVEHVIDLLQAVSHFLKLIARVRYIRAESVEYEGMDRIVLPTFNVESRGAD